MSTCDAAGMPKHAIFAKFTAQPGKGEELVEALSPMFDTVPGEPGTEVYVLHTSPNEPDVVWFYEIYTDDASFKSHGGSDAFKGVMAKAGPLLSGRPEVTFGSPLNAKGVAV